MISSVYEVGFLAYLVGDSHKKELNMDNFEVEGRKVFEFTFLSLDEYKREFVRRMTRRNQ